MAGGVASADTISPETYATTLEIGESVTIRKTVVIDDAPPDTALLDVHFLFDTSGSMGGEIADAKAAAGVIATDLAGFGDFAVSVGAFAENAGLVGDPCVFTSPGSACSTSGDLIAAPGAVINQDVTPGDLSGIGDIQLNDPDYGGDGDERGNDAVKIAADNLSWRPGSNRVIVAFGDAGWKEDITSDAAVMASLAAGNIDLIGINYGSSAFAADITDLGGTVFSGGTSPSDVAAAILAGITSTFATYSTVQVTDMLAGMPGVDVDVTCISADIGSCSGDTATGVYDREDERTFEFDVTFTALEAGVHVFDTVAKVDTGIVARENDTITVSAIPLPAAGWMVLAGLGGLGAIRRKQRKA